MGVAGPGSAAGAELTAESNLIDMPVMVAIGDQDFLLDGVRAFGEQLKAPDANAGYQEFPRLDHGTIILGSMPDVYRFFADHQAGPLEGTDDSALFRTSSALTLS